jgi:hypothetical protein
MCSVDARSIIAHWLGAAQYAPAHAVCNMSVHCVNYTICFDLVQRCRFPVYLCTLLLQHFNICCQIRILHEGKLQAQQLQQYIDRLMSQGQLEAAESTHALAADVITRTGVWWALSNWKQAASVTDA